MVGFHQADRMSGPSRFLLRKGQRPSEVGRRSDWQALVVSRHVVGENRKSVHVFCPVSPGLSGWAGSVPSGRPSGRQTWRRLVERRAPVKGYR